VGGRGRVPVHDQDVWDIEERKAGGRCAQQTQFSKRFRICPGRAIKSSNLGGTLPCTLAYFFCLQLKPDLASAKRPSHAYPQYWINRIAITDAA